MTFKREAMLMPFLSRRPAACYIYPFRKTTSHLAFDINDVGVALASAANTVLLHRIPCFPKFVFFFPLFLVRSRHFEERRSGQLPVPRRICWAMLYGRMPIPNISEVVDVARS